MNIRPTTSFLIIIIRYIACCHMVFEPIVELFHVLFGNPSITSLRILLHKKLSVLEYIWLHRLHMF